MFGKQLLHKFIFMSLIFAIITIFGGVVHGAKNDKDGAKKHYAIDEATLQSHVMSFADRFFSILTSAFSQYVALEPSKKNRYEVQYMVTYSMSHAYIIAGEDDPGVALLDVLTMVMLGRIIFEEEGLKRYGKRKCVCWLSEGFIWLPACRSYGAFMESFGCRGCLTIQTWQEFLRIYRNSQKYLLV